jgi:immunoglobulin-binding protein 1
MATIAASSSSNDSCTTLSLKETFLRAQEIFQALENGGNTTNASPNANDCAQMFEECSRLIRRENLFSANETEEDLTTSTLSYLLVPGYLGKLYGGMVRVDMAAEGPAGRYKQVRRSILHFTSFLTRLDGLEMLKKEDKDFFDLDADSRKESPDQKRARKLNDFSEERSLKEQLGTLQAQQARQRASGKEVDESTIRELYTVLVQSFVKAALSGIDMGKRELEMLEVMRERLGPRFYGASQMERENPKLAEARREMEERKRLAKAAEEYKNRPGLSVTHIAPDGTTKQERLKAEVFRPGWNQPTMSLEKFADLELKDAIARGERSKKAEENKSRTYEQLCEDGLEDDEELVEKARVKDSEWANWKDDNPKGSGITKWC